MPVTGRHEHALAVAAGSEEEDEGVLVDVAGEAVS
jgi:hypothetical protein